MDATPDVARLEPLPPSQWPAAMRQAMAVIRPPNPRHQPLQAEGRPKALNALGVLARHVELTHAWNTFNGHVLLGTTLSERQRELLVLRVAWLRGCAYEWRQHEVIAQDVGIDAAEIARVKAGPEAVEWSPLERALLQAADDLVADARVGDAAWTELSSEFDEQQLIDVVFTVGAYEVLAMAFRSFGIQFDDDMRK